MGTKIEEEVYNKISKTIIRKLYTAKCFGKGHMLKDRFKSSLPSHMLGDVDSVLKDLMKREIILPYGMTKYGFAVYLNIKKLDEIEIILGNKG